MKRGGSSLKILCLVMVLLLLLYSYLLPAVLEWTKLRVVTSWIDFLQGRLSMARHISLSVDKVDCYLVMIQQFCTGTRRHRGVWFFVDFRAFFVDQVRIMPRRAGREIGWRAQDLRPCYPGHMAGGYGVTF